LKIEEKGDPGLDSISIEGYSPKEINYHLRLLYDSGLIDAEPVIDVVSEIDWIIRGLTWEGHGFIEAAHDNSRWEKAKKTVIDKVGSLIFDLLSKTLIDLATQQLKS